MKKLVLLSVAAATLVSCKNREFNSEVASNTEGNSEGVAKFRCKSEEPFNELFVNSKEIILKGSSFGSQTFGAPKPQKASLRSFDKMRVYNVASSKKAYRIFISKNECRSAAGMMGYDFVAVSVNGEPNNVQGCCSIEAL